MTFIRIARIVPLALLVVGVALSAGAESWDQERITELASQLEETLGLALQSAEAASQQRTVMQQRTRDAALVEMRQAHEFSREYASKIRAGWGRGDSFSSLDGPSTPQQRVP